MYLLAPHDAGYPAPLLRLDQPPVLSMSQRLSLGSEPCVLFSGTTHPDHQGFHDAWMWALCFARLGWHVITSMDGGCDLAVRRALVRNGFRPLVVESHAREHVRTREMAFLSLHDEKCYRKSSPLAVRSELASALCLVCVIVQAPARSLPLLVARDVLDEGGEVLLLPCAVGKGTAREGSSQLREEGALILTRCIKRHRFVVE